MYEGKGVWFGVLLFVVGLLWYAQDSGLINIPYFWPTVLMLLGILFALKATFVKGTFTGVAKKKR